MQIRKYVNQDFEKLKNLLEEAEMFDKEWDSSENLSSIKILVAEENLEIIGVIYITGFGEKIGWLFRLAVRKDKRNQGVATSLITKAENILKENGAEEIGMFVDANDLELQSFYKKRNYGSSKKPYIYMHKSLVNKK